MEKLKGMCRNEGCEHCDEIFEVEKTDFRCPYCDKDLFPMDTPPPPPPKWIKIAIIGTAAAALLGGGAYIAFSGSEPIVIPEFTIITLDKTTASVIVGDVDTLKATVIPESAGYTLRWASNKPDVATVNNGIVTFHSKGEAKIGVQVNEDKSLRAFCDYIVKEKNDRESSTGTLTLSHGKYTGEIKNGKPHGEGRLVYAKEHIINKHDVKKRKAQPGEYVQGQFVNGEITIGKHFDANGNLIQSLNLGVAE